MLEIEPGKITTACMSTAKEKVSLVTLMLRPEQCSEPRRLSQRCSWRSVKASMLGKFAMSECEVTL